MSSWQEPPVLDYPVPSEIMSDSENRDSGLRLTGRWYALALLALTLVLSMTTWLSASAVMPQLRTEWDLSDNAAAWLTIAVQLGFVCGALVSSLVTLSDVLSPRHVILGGSIGAALANVLLEIAGTRGLPRCQLRGRGRARRAKLLFPVRLCAGERVRAWKRVWRRRPLDGRRARARCPRPG